MGFKPKLGQAFKEKGLNRLTGPTPIGNPAQSCWIFQTGSNTDEEMVFTNMVFHWVDVTEKRRQSSDSGSESGGAGKKSVEWLDCTVSKICCCRGNDLEVAVFGFLFTWKLLQNVFSAEVPRGGSRAMIFMKFRSVDGARFKSPLDAAFS